MQVVSQQVVRLLGNLGLRGRSAERVVPEAILRAPRAVQAAFLRGLFEGDGCVERSGRSLMRVSLVSASKRLLQQVQVMLLHFGIVARLTQDTRGTTWRLILTGARNLQRYAASIGFVSEAKRKGVRGDSERRDGARAVQDRLCTVPERVCAPHGNAPPRVAE
jgi:intein/homing endonuclease